MRSTVLTYMQSFHWTFSVGLALAHPNNWSGYSSFHMNHVSCSCTGIGPRFVLLAAEYSLGTCLSWLQCLHSVTPSDIVTTFILGNSSAQVQHFWNCKDASKEWNFNIFQGWLRIGACGSICHWIWCQTQSAPAMLVASLEFLNVKHTCIDTWSTPPCTIVKLVSLPQRQPWPYLLKKVFPHCPHPYCWQQCPRAMPLSCLLPSSAQLIPQLYAGCCELASCSTLSLSVQLIPQFYAGLHTVSSC